jgi:hypothetical protein
MTQKGVFLVVVLISTAFFVGRITSPEKIEIKEKIVTVEKEVVNQDTETKENKIVIVHEYPNGLRVTKTRSRSNQTVNTQTKKEIATATDKKTTVESSKKTLVYAIIPAIKSGQYGLGVSHSFIGPIELGAQFKTDLSVSLSVGIRF